MVGISSYGVHVPYYRLNREAIAKGQRGEKAIANFDEDSVTMAVAAAMNCLNGVDRESVDRLLCASTTFPYKEKQASAMIAAACDLPRNIFTADFASSLKGGTSAVISAADAVTAKTAKQVLVTAADCRPTAPLSEFEPVFGDGAAALLISDSDVAVSLEASYSVSDEIMDIWRTQHDRFVHAWEARFNNTQGYQPVTAEAITGLLKKCSMSPKDFSKIVLYTPDQRGGAQLAKSLGFDPKTQLQDPLFAYMGNTGTPFSLMLLVAALEEAKPDDAILLASYGDGADAFVLRVTKQIENLKKRKGMKEYLASKKVIDDYRTYLTWRGLLNPDSEKVYPVPYGTSSMPATWRERNRILRLHASKCKVCGTVQLPPQRVCTRCRTKDQFDEVRLSDKKGTIHAFSMDAISSVVDSPAVIPWVDFEGGGRGEFYMTDRIPEEIKIGMTVEMSFRKLFLREGIYHYYWKAVPPRV